MRIEGIRIAAYSVGSLLLIQSLSCIRFIYRQVLLKAAPAAPAAPATINDTYCSGPRVRFFSGHMKISRRSAVTML